jgi:hypothetical protein
VLTPNCETFTYKDMLQAALNTSSATLPALLSNGVSNHARKPSPVHLINLPPAASTKTTDKNKKRWRNFSSDSADSSLLRYFEEL